MRNYKLFGWYVWPWPATFPGISFWIINRIQKWEINHNHMKESGLNTTVNFTVFSINAENSRVVVYWGNRSFKMASNTEEFLTGNGLEGILTVIASDVLSLQRKFPKYRRTLSKKCPHFSAFVLNSHFSHIRKMRTRITPNTDTFHAVESPRNPFLWKNCKKNTLKKGMKSSSISWTWGLHKHVQRELQSPLKWIWKSKVIKSN